MAKDLIRRQIDRLFGAGTVAGMAEVQLLERYATRRDESAFAALVARHGPMVLAVCRGLLDDPHEAEDAFQATFLVLMRKAGTLRRPDRLGPWLYGVASRVAARARSRTARRRAVERRGAERRANEPAREVADDDLRGALHEEVGRLPSKYRDPVVFCYLEGLSHDEAARALGWPVGTVKGRLSRARDLLRTRLGRRGVTAPATLLAATLAREATAAVPTALAGATIRAALATAGAVPAPIAALAEGTLRSMAMNRVKIGAALLLSIGTVATGAGVLAYQAPGKGSPPGKATGPSPRAADRAAILSQGAQARLTLARQAWEMLRRLYLDGELADVDKLDLWSRRLAQAEFDVAKAQPERIAAVAAHRDRIRTLLDAVARRFRNGDATSLDYIEMQFHDAEAVQWLAEVGGRVGPRPSAGGGSNLSDLFGNPPVTPPPPPPPGPPPSAAPAEPLPAPAPSSDRRKMQRAPG